MAVEVIIIGALGRMGRTLVSLVQANPKFSLVGVVESETHIAEAKQIGVYADISVEAVLEKKPHATLIDFTTPALTLHTASLAAEYGAKHVIGTTGFNEADMANLFSYADQTTLFWAPNMSLGVNALCKVLPSLVKALGPDYDLEILEMHHNKKKDAPSGTALLLADCLAQAKDWDLEDVACYHREGITGERPKKEIGVQAIRGGDIVGVHTVYLVGEGERIEVSHHAQSRENFAHGALRAALWIQDKPKGKLYTMQDLFK